MTTKYQVFYQRNRERILSEDRQRRQEAREEKLLSQKFLCVNHFGVPAIPLNVASAVVHEWCAKNVSEIDAEEDIVLAGSGGFKSKPYVRLAELSDVHVRIMFDIYKCTVRPSRHGTRTAKPNVSLATMDKIVTFGMDEPQRWYLPPLDLYYIPLDEWTDEMKERYERN